MMPQRLIGLFLLLVLLLACAQADEGGSFLDRYLDPDANRDEGARLAVEMEKAMGDCMAENGFEYVPFLYKSDVPLRSLRAAVLTGTDDDFTNEFGYGVVASLGRVEALRREDPNRAIFQDLSLADQDAYVVAQTKCVETRDKEFENELFEVDFELANEILTLDQEILADDRVLAALPAWAECMTQHGYSYSHLAEPMEDLQSTVPEVLEPLIDASGPLEGYDEALAELVSSELHLAADDVSCRNQSGIVDVIEVVREELEAAFASENAELIQRYDDALANGS